MRTPSLQSLRLFMSVAETGSFSETARVSNLSQPALSRTIKLLEIDFGVRLFDRNSRNVMLTAAGSALLPIVSRLTADFDQAFVELAASFAGERGRVVLGALPSAAALTLPGLIARFQADRPGVEVILRDALSGALDQQLIERQIDFAISTPPENDADIAFEPLMEDELVLVARPGDLESFPEVCPWLIFAAHPFIAMAPRSSVRLLTDVALARAEVRAKPLFECAQIATVGGLIAAGLGISALPLSTVPMLAMGGAVGWRPLAAPRAARTIGIAQLRQRSLSPAAAALRTHLVSHRQLQREIDQPS